jgi:ABC-2 type transport system ATP-binding protein
LNNLLEIKNIYKSYGEHTALNDVSLNIPSHCIFGLLGPNGAGKTSLIRIITRILIQDKGEIYFKGEPLSQKHTKHIGYLPEERGLYKKMGVKEHLIYLAKLKSVPPAKAKAKIHEYLEKFDLVHWGNKNIEDLSKGMQQKVQFIATILNDPELIILDEPFSGFDPINANIIKKEILELKQKGATIIYSTHRMETVEELCDELALINKSRKILDGTVKEVINSYKENIYILEGKGKIEKNVEYFTVLSEEVSLNGISKIRFSLKNEISSNQLLSYLLDKFEIHSFKEELPSINDIFIAKVKQQNE